MKHVRANLAPADSVAVVAATGSVAVAVTAAVAAAVDVRAAVVAVAGLPGASHAGNRDLMQPLVDAVHFPGVKFVVRKTPVQFPEQIQRLSWILRA